MSKVWVQAINIVRYDENGLQKTANRGDWCQLGRQQARDELSKGNIKILKPTTLQAVQDLTDCTILVQGVMHDNQRLQLSAKYPSLPIEARQGLPDKAGRFLLWDMNAHLQQDLILVGFGLLQKWQLAIPLLSYDILAQDVGGEQERMETKEVIHDLRVPLYDTRVIFARQCQEVQRLLGEWDGSQLGFLRALYKTPMRVLALPPSWVME